MCCEVHRPLVLEAAVEVNPSPELLGHYLTDDCRIWLFTKVDLENALAAKPQQQRYIADSGR